MTPLNFICHQMASSFKDLSLDWLIQNNDDVMILIFDQQEEYYANQQRYSKTLELHENLPIYRLPLIILSVWLLVFLLFTCIIIVITAIVIVILAFSIPTEQCLPI